LRDHKTFTEKEIARKCPVAKEHKCPFDKNGTVIEDKSTGRVGGVSRY